MNNTNWDDEPDAYELEKGFYTRVRKSVGWAPLAAIAATGLFVAALYGSQAILPWLPTP